MKVNLFETERFFVEFLSTFCHIDDLFRDLFFEAKFK